MEDATDGDTMNGNGHGAAAPPEAEAAPELAPEPEPQPAPEAPVLLTNGLPDKRYKRGRPKPQRSRSAVSKPAASSGNGTKPVVAEEPPSSLLIGRMLTEIDAEVARLERARRALLKA